MLRYYQLFVKKGAQGEEDKQVTTAGYKLGEKLQDSGLRALDMPVFLFWGHRIVVYSFEAKQPSGDQTDLRYAGTTT